MVKYTTPKLSANNTGANYNTPWTIGSQTKSSATVTTILFNDKVFLVTNAHAVNIATELTLTFSDSSHEFPVECVYIDPTTDLAILKLKGGKDISAYIKPLPLDEKGYPKSNTKVLAYGYPVGGTNLSTVSGTISRTVYTNNAFSKITKTTFTQTSAPINPGNSGGPVLNETENPEERRILGIVCSGLSGTDVNNVGYFIPAATIRNVLTAYQKKTVLEQIGKKPIRGSLPVLNLEFQSMQNKNFRAWCGLTQDDEDAKDRYGIRVTKIPISSCAYDILKPGDIILAIDGVKIISDGTIRPEELEESIDWQFLIQQKQLGETVSVKVRRKDETHPKQFKDIELSIKLNKKLTDTLEGVIDSKIPEFYIHPAGFVFSVADGNLRRSFWTHYSGNIIDSQRTPNQFSEFFGDKTTSKRQVVILHKIFENTGDNNYGSMDLSGNSTKWQSHAVTEVNGQPITSLCDLAEALDDAHNKEGFSEVKFSNGTEIIIPNKVDPTKIAELRSTHRISFFTSNSLRKPQPEVIRVIQKEMPPSDNNYQPSKIKGRRI